MSTTSTTTKRAVILEITEGQCVIHRGGEPVTKPKLMKGGVPGPEDDQYVCDLHKNVEWTAGYYILSVDDVVKLRVALVQEKSYEKLKPDGPYPDMESAHEARAVLAHELGEKTEDVQPETEKARDLQTDPV